VPALLQSTHAPCRISPVAVDAAADEPPMSRDDAIKHWVSKHYDLPLDDIASVRFDVENAERTMPARALPHLEIEVVMSDGHEHLYTRGVRDFGRIVEEVLEAARS
jgi:hypothetical protein